MARRTLLYQLEHCTYHCSYHVDRLTKQKHWVPAKGDLTMVRVTAGPWKTLSHMPKSWLEGVHYHTDGHSFQDSELDTLAFSLEEAFIALAAKIRAKYGDQDARVQNMKSLAAYSKTLPELSPAS